MTCSTTVRKRKNVHHIGGIPVEFPFEPYGSQLAFMARVISTLDRAQRDGHYHSLLESPTGTGKSLSLLCSALAWQQNYKSKNLSANPDLPKPDPAALTDPLAHGGGFVPETQPSASGNPDPSQSAGNNKASKKKTAPTIFYASRTHSQITQVIREYRKTAYRVPMAVLASRKHYCTNRHVHGSDNIDEECKLLLNNKEVGCAEFKNAHKVKGHPSIRKGGCHEVHDIEDIVKVGQDVKGCSYFAARSMADDAQLVFCPYSYVVNPVIRKAMEVDIRGAILILDEAHNIEDMARDAGSMDVDEDVLYKLQTELGQLTFANTMVYQPLHEMIQDITSWMQRRKNALEKREFQHYFSCWTGDKALSELQEANISRQCFSILQDCARKAIKAASDAEPEVAHLTGMSATALEGLFSSLSYFFSGDGVHINDYQLALQRCIKRGPGNAATGWKYSLSLWCLNPAVVFREIADLSLSVILTSGTLSPMNSFSSELGVQFGISLEAPHVINVDSQLWAAVISTGPGNYPLNASYKTMDGYAFQDALGTSLEEICKVVPGGSLIFFPSYKLMEKLCNRWRETGQWSRLNARKTLFVEPRGGSQEDFEPVLKGYYDSIQGRKPAIGRNRKGKKIGLTNSDSIDGKPKSKEGAAFLAVCRGKVSEGIDFSDENARVVIIVGIPFPNVNDIQVAQKKKYNDTYKSTRSLLSGNEWYCQQAFRALNQAAGRCIRHRFDFGAVILLDERFREERNIMYVSKWLRKSIRQYDSFHKSLEELETFFRDVEERIAKETANTAQDSVINVENISDMDQGKGCSKRNIVKESNKCVSKPSNNMMAIERKARLCESPTYVEKFSATSIKSKSEDDVNVQASLLMDKKDSGSSTEYMDLECSSDNISRCNEGLSTTFPHDTELSSVMKTSSPLCRYSGRISTAFSNDDIELTIVKETPGTDGCVSVPSPESFSKDETSSSTVIHGSIKFQFLQSTSLDSHLGPSKSTFPLVGTPEKSFTTDTSCLLAERDSLLNLSVNSHTQKRRKLLGLKSVSCAQAEECEANNPTTPEHLSTNASLVTAKDVNHRIEFGLVNDCSQELNKFNSPQLLAGNSFWASNTSTGDVEDKKQRIFCSLCKNPLGLPENHLYVGCSITSLSKPYLVALLKGRSETPAEKTSSCVSVAISDISSVDQRLYNKNPEYTLGQGIWCPEDGCVFKTLFCPFCSNTDNCLGVQILAADALNVHLLNKIVFYQDRLEIEDVEASKRKDSSPGGGSGLDYCSVPIPIEKFAYIPVQESSEGWRTTRTKMQLPKRRVLPTTRRWG